MGHTRTRTRMMALLLVLCMILPILPISAQAATEEFLTTEELVEAGFAPEDEIFVIVETGDKPAVERNRRFFSGSLQAEADKAEAEVKASEARIHAQAKKAEFELETNATFSVLEAGASMKLKVKDVDKLKGISEIKSVKPEAYIERVPLEEAKSEVQAIDRDASTKMYTSLDQVSAKQAWDLGYKGEGMLAAVIDTGIDPDHDDWNTAEMDKLVEDGKTKYSEASINEKLKDPKLAERFTNGETTKGKYFNSKVVYGYNYSDRNNNIVDSFSEQHGQHVGGTIAATGREGVKESVTGVAPHAQLLAMKVFSNDQLRSVVWEHIWVEAMEDAVLLGADVLNLSLGSFWSHMVDDNETLTGKAIETARANGVVTAIAAGNDRNNTWGYNYHNLAENIDTSAMGNPANRPDTFAVGSIDNNFVQVKKLIFNGKEFNISSPYNEGHAEDTAVFYPAWADTENNRFYAMGDFDDVKAEDVEGKLVACYRGNGSFGEKYENALNKGAEGLIIIDNQKSPFPFNMTGINARDEKPVILISTQQGEELIKYVRSNENPTVTITKDKYKVNIHNTDTLSEFSSWGPAMDLSLKPDISAPGGNITSLQNDNKYMVMGGTSMATPHIAGGTALVMQHLESAGYVTERNDDRVQLAEMIMMNTADPIKDPASDLAYYSPRQIGAGMMNLEKALKTDVALKVTGTNDERVDGKFEIRSVSENPTVKLELEALGQVTGLREYKVSAVFVEDIINDEGRITEKTRNAKTVDLGTISLANPTLDAELDIGHIKPGQYIEGYIFLESQGDYPSLGAPFFGFKEGNDITWDNLPIIDEMNSFENNSNFKPIPWENGIDQTAFIRIRKEGGFNYWSQWFEGDERTVFFNTSDNGGEFVKGLTPNISFLRHAMDIRFNILDKDKNNLRELFIMNRVAKSAFFGDNKYNFLNWDPDTNWDGTVKKELQEDGEYYYQILGKAAVPNAKDQEYLYKLVLDNTAPEVEAVFDKDTREITIEASDELSGLTWIGFEDSQSGKVWEDNFTDKENRNHNQIASFKVPNTPEYNSGKLYAYAWDASGNVGNFEIEIPALAEEDLIPLREYVNGENSDELNQLIADIEGIFEEIFKVREEKKDILLKNDLNTINDEYNWFNSAKKDPNINEERLAEYKEWLQGFLEYLEAYEKQDDEDKNEEKVKDKNVYKRPWINVKTPGYYDAFGEKVKTIDINLEVSRIASIESIELYFVDKIPEIVDGEEENLTGKIVKSKLELDPEVTKEKDYNIVFKDTIPMSIVDLSEGLQGLRVKVVGKDAAGEPVEAEVIREIRIDRTPVKLEISEYPETTDQPKVDINIKGIENMSYFEVLLDDNMIIREDQTWDSIAPREVEADRDITLNLKPGENTFTLKAYDDAGNETVETITITYTGEDTGTTDPEPENPPVEDPNKEIKEKEVAAIEETLKKFEDLDLTDEIKEELDALKEEFDGYKEDLENTRFIQLRGLHQRLQDLLEKAEDPGQEPEEPEEPENPDEPDDKPGQNPDEKPDDKPGNKPGDKPSEKPDDKPGNIGSQGKPGTTPENPLDKQDEEEKDKEEAEREELKNAKRVAGENRIETAAKISKRAFAKADHVILAGSLASADALAAGPYAELVNGPILQVSKDKLDLEVITELLRLGAKEITIVGGQASVSENVEKELKDRGLTVNRIMGENRFETSLKVAEKIVRENPDYTAFIVNGISQADALTISPVAAKKNSPILLTDGQGFVKGMEKLVEGAKERVIVGGPNSVDPKICEGVDKIIAGENRYETSLLIAKEYFQDSDRVLLASGTVFVDALSASSLSVAENAPILLGTRDGLTEEVKAYANNKDIVIIGGPAVINK